LSKALTVGIVGGGVAGSSCAQVLGAAGVRTLVFDHSHPREKACGGLIEERVVGEFDIPEKLLENEVRWCLAERFGFRVKLAFKPSMFLVSRKDFDYYLIKRATENKSVTFLPEKVVNIAKTEEGWTLRTNNHRRVKVNVLIGADGCPSFIRGLVFKPMYRGFLAATFGYNLTCPTEFIQGAFSKNTIEVYYLHECVRKGGYIWIFPRKSSINIGIGGMDRVERLKESLETFIVSHPAGRRFKQLTGRPFAHLVPAVWMVDFFGLPCAGEDWALIGDAAGHVNSIAGAGIYYAMKGGALCGQAILDGDLSLFERYWRNEYGEELQYGAKNVLPFYGNLGLFLWLRYIFENLLGRLNFG
jgi:geranylgeranyl reductase family protein